MMQELQNFSSCDISDALNAIGGKDATGQLTDILPMTALAGDTKIVGPAYTARFGWVSEDCAKPSVNHIDTIPKGSIVVIKSPSTGINAVFGGL